MRHKVVSFGVSLSVPVVLMALWMGAARLGLTGRIPSPETVADAALSQLGDSGFYSHFGATISRALISFVVSAVLGMGLGCAIGISGRVGLGIEAVVDFLRSIPAPALLPVFMSLFGLYSGPKLALAIFVCTLVVTVYTAYGVRGELGSLRTEWLDAIGASRIFILRHVLLPGSVTAIISGLRVSFSLSLVLSTLAELVLMTGNGAGVLIRIAFEDGKTGQMYALIFLLGLVGFLLTVGFSRLERAVVIRWRSTPPPS